VIWASVDPVVRDLSPRIENWNKIYNKQMLSTNNNNTVSHQNLPNIPQNNTHNYQHPEPLYQSQSQHFSTIPVSCRSSLFEGSYNNNYNNTINQARNQQTKYQTYNPNNPSINDTSSAYTPYTLKDYQKIRERDSAKVGKLGPNLYTEKWSENLERNNKIKKYSNLIKEENKVLLKDNSIREQDRELKEAIERIHSSSRMRQSRYGKKVEDLRIGVNLSPYIVYNNKKNKEKNLLNKSRQYYEGNDKIRFRSNDQNNLSMIKRKNIKDILKENARENILKNFKGSFV